MKATLEKLRKTKKLANTEVVGGDASTTEGQELNATIPSRQMRQRQAKLALPDVRKELQVAMNERVFTVFVSGPGSQEAARLASEQTDVVVIDSNDAFGEAKWAANMALGNSREWTPSVHSAMLVRIRQLGTELGLTYIPDIPFENVVALPDKTAVDAHVDHYLSKYLGADLVASVLVLRAVRKAEDVLDGAAPVYPVFVLNVTETLANKIGPKFFGGRYTTLNAPDDVTEKDVIAVFNTIKKTLKKNKKEEQNE